MPASFAISYKYEFHSIQMVCHQSLSYVPYKRPTEHHLNVVKKRGSDSVNACPSQNENEFIKCQCTQDEQFPYTKMHV